MNRIIGKTKDGKRVTFFNIDKEKKYINDLIEINEELKQVKEQHKEEIKKKDDLLDEAFVIVSCQLNDNPELKKMVTDMSMRYLEQFYGKPIIDEESGKKFADFVHKKQVKFLKEKGYEIKNDK